MSPFLLRWLARWLLGAMLLAALAPAVSRTLAVSRQAGDWVEICTMEGMLWSQVGGGDARLASNLDEGLLHALDRCGHCTLASDRFAPLVPAVPVVGGDPDAHLVPEHISSVIWAVNALHPSARGPPFLY